jgi:hypothetical protein
MPEVIGPPHLTETSTPISVPEVRHCLHQGLHQNSSSSLQFSLLVKDRVVFIKFSLSSFWSTRGSSIILPLQRELFHPSLVIVFRLEHRQYLQTSSDGSINDYLFPYPVTLELRCVIISSVVKRTFFKHNLRNLRCGIRKIFLYIFVSGFNISLFLFIIHGSS